MFVACAGVALQVRSALGLGPWDVLHQGVAERLDIGIGVALALVAIPVLLLWIPLRQRLGMGTVVNTTLAGFGVTFWLSTWPELHSTAARWAALPASVALLGLGCGIYLGAGMGPGPRDGLMTGLAARGLSIRTARTVVEVSAMCTGALLGGTVGVGTVVMALGLGPIVQVTLGWFRVDPLVPTPTPVAAAVDVV
jgi:uncharacterized membrane protein YczE